MTMTQKNGIRAKKGEAAKAKPALAAKDGQLIDGEDNKYENTAALSQAIEDIAKGVVRLDDHLKYVLTGISVQIVCKAEAKFGIKLANDLLKALGKGVVRNSRVIWWLTTNAPLKYVKDGKSGSFEITGKLLEMKSAFEKDRSSFVKTRNAKPYSGEEFKKEKDATQAFNFNKQLKALIAKAAKAKNELATVKGGGVATKFNPAEIDLGIYEEIISGKYDALSTIIKKPVEAAKAA